MLEVLEGSSSESAALHRRKAVTMSMGVGSKNRVNQAILSALPSGDWSVADRAQVFVQLGGQLLDLHQEQVDGQRQGSGAIGHVTGC